MAPLCLPTEIALAVVGLEECSNRLITIESDKRAARLVEARCRSVAPQYLLDISANRTVPKRLRSKEIVRFGHAWELSTMLGEMFIQIVLRAKSDRCID